VVKRLMQGNNQQSGLLFCNNQVFCFVNCSTYRQYFRTQIVSISRKERGVAFLNLPVRFRRSTQSESCDKVNYQKRFFKF